MPEWIEIVIKEDDVSTMLLTSVTNAIIVCSHTLPLLSNSLPFSLHVPFYFYTQGSLSIAILLCAVRTSHFYISNRDFFSKLSRGIICF